MTQPLTKWTHTPEGELKCSDIRAAALVEGTRLRIIKANKAIIVGDDHVGNIGTTTASTVQLTKQYRDRIYAEYDDDRRGTIYCHAHMVEIVG